MQLKCKGFTAVENSQLLNYLYDRWYVLSHSISPQTVKGVLIQTKHLAPFEIGTFQILICIWKAPAAIIGSKADY
jgi:hypothetical protein